MVILNGFPLEVVHCLGWCHIMTPVGGLQDMFAFFPQKLGDGPMLTSIAIGPLMVNDSLKA